MESDLKSKIAILLEALAYVTWMQSPCVAVQYHRCSNRVWGRHLIYWNLSICKSWVFPGEWRIYWFIKNGYVMVAVFFTKTIEWLGHGTNRSMSPLQKNSLQNHQRIFSYFLPFKNMHWTLKIYRKWNLYKRPWFILCWTLIIKPNFLSRNMKPFKWSLYTHRKQFLPIRTVELQEKVTEKSSLPQEGKEEK